jgi:hypothetical protein
MVAHIHLSSGKVIPQFFESDMITSVRFPLQEHAGGSAAQFLPELAHFHAILAEIRNCLGSGENPTRDSKRRI